MAPPTPPPDALELLRSQSGLSIDEEGRLCHRGEPITHARTLEVLWRSLERDPSGRYAVRVGRELAYVRVDDAPYAVRAVTFPEAGPLLHLSDGTAEPLDPVSLSVDGAGVLHCRVKGSAHAARFRRAAQLDLGQALEEDPAHPGRHLLRVGGRAWPIGPA